MRKFNYKKYLYPCVVSVLVAFFVGGVVIGGASVMHMDGAYPPYEPDAALTQLPQTADEALGILNAALSDVYAIRPKIKIESDCSFDGDDISVTAANGYDSLFEKYAGAFSSDGAEDKLEELYDKSCSIHEYESDYGDGGAIDSLLGKLILSASDITSVESTDDRWVCSNCGESKNELFDRCEECKLNHTAQKRKRDTISVTLTIGSLPGFFPQRSNSDLTDLLNDKGNGLYAVGNLKTEYPEVKLMYELDRLNGNLRTLVFKVKTRLTAALKPVEQLSEYGDITVSCLYDDDIRYSISMPSISLNDQEPLRPGKTMTVEPRKTEAIKFSHKPDDRPVEIRWESSDESVLKVDADGYVKAGKKPGEATVTATLVFDGRSFSDTVKIYVRVPVEKTNLNKYNLSLATGETHQLSVTVSPRNATVQTVTWYSGDEHIAAVDENGVVTAVSPGSTVIYALSDDGYFKASCKTEVH
ncbi:MAG: Ig domain-containing protein [Clostridia bacterium]|nr:Ig domain-containing protein [Clostridia bacterium]